MDQNSENQEPSAQELINDLKFCVFDLETTGGNHKYDKIIEIGLIKVENLTISDELNFLINPQIEIPDFIQKLTSIKPEQLVDSPTIEEVIDQILEFMGDTILVAHNSSFDVPFFNSVLERAKRKQLSNRVICTNLMTKYLIPDIMNSNLGYMSRIFNISHDKAHRALEDARAASELLIKYLDFFINKNIRKINQLYYPRNKFELDRCHFYDGDDHQEILTKLKKCKSPVSITFKGEKGVILSCIPFHYEKYPHSLSFVEEAIANLPWKNVTLKMVGTVIESFIYFNSQYPKLSQETREQMIGFIENTYLEGFAGDGKQNPRPDFLITRHIIPSQLVIYPLLNLQAKNHLIFRYPGHRKKMFQYVFNHIRKFETFNKHRPRTCIHKELQALFVKMTQKFVETESENHMVFSSRDIKNNEKKFALGLEKFLAKNENPYNYPCDHI